MVIVESFKDAGAIGLGVGGWERSLLSCCRTGMSVDWSRESFAKGRNRESVGRDCRLGAGNFGCGVRAIR